MASIYGLGSFSQFVSPACVLVTPKLGRAQNVVMAASNSHIATFHPPSKKGSSCSSVDVAERVQRMNYRPTIWHYASIQSLGTSHSRVQGSTSHGEQIMEKLVQAVSLLFEQAGEEDEIRTQLRLVDAVEHLGMGYLFEKEIKKVLDNVTVEGSLEEDLYTTALQFRLLRQHSYEVSQDVFQSFRDKDGFKPKVLEDIEGLLSLYEASHVAFEREEILDEARVFSSNRLCRGDLQLLEPGLAMKVQHALELPRNRRMTWLEARWYIDSYQQEPWAEPAIVELSKLHFNMVQAIHRRDVKHMSVWWKDLGLASRLSFARDRLMESFYWSAGLVYEPQFRYCRQQITEVAQLLTAIDEIYDVYGTLEELQLFTEAVDRWDENSIEQLPGYMKTSFEALFSSVKKIGEDTSEEHGRDDITPYLTKAWGDLCKSFLVEAEWYKNQTRPTLQEYLENGWVSVAGPLLLTFAYYLLAPKPSNYKETGSLQDYMDLIRCSSMIFRLCNDLAVPKEELDGGDSINAVQLYMDEIGATEESARKYLRSLITKYWKRLSDHRTVSCFMDSQTFINVITNLARNAETVYLHGDGFSAPDGYTKGCVTLLLAESLPVGK